MFHADREQPLPSRDELQKILTEQLTIQPRKKLVELMGAYNRITAEDIFAERSLPTTYIYKEDGIAIAFARLQELQAKDLLVEGEDYIHANQGWPVTKDFDTVIPLDDLTYLPRGLKIKNWPTTPGSYVNPPGSIMQKDDLLVPKHTIIDGSIMGLLAMGGIQAVPVFARPRILFIPTGDELVEWQQRDLAPGENIESNSVMVHGFAQKLRCKLEVMPIIPDEKDALIDALHYAKDLADLVIISAGCSRGNKDFTKEILAHEGTLLVGETGFEPGRYLKVATMNNTPILALPGSPKGVELTLGFCLPPIVQQYYQQPLPPKKLVPVKADFQFQSKANLDACLELILRQAEDGYHGQIILGKNLTKGHNLREQRGIYYLPRGEAISLGQELLVEILS